MKLNKWTVGLASAGVVSLASVAYAEEQAMSQVLTAVSSTTLSGYVDTSAIWKPGDGNAALPGRAFDGVGKLDSFNLNVVGLTLEKPLGEDQWAAGYRMDLLFGPDAVGYNPSYFGTTQIGGGDFGIKQAYVNLRVPVGNGLDFKMGTFNTIIGYESFESYLNPNFSRSYGWQLEPTQHTGLLANYRLSEAVSVAGGIADTWVAGINRQNAHGPGGTTTESMKAYMTSLTITAPDSWGFLSGSALYGGVVNGFSGNTKNTTSTYVGLSMQTGVEGLSVGAAYDYRNNGANTVVVGQNWAYAIAGYVTYQATEKWKLSFRGDLTQGSDGTFYDRTSPGSSGQNRLASLTLTADYALWANVVSRAEFRWDHSVSGDSPYGGEATSPGGDKNAVTLAANLIYKF